MRLNKEITKDLEAVSLPIIKSEDNGIGIDNLYEDSFPGESNDLIKDKVKQYIYILKEYDLIIEKPSKLCGFEYYASERLKYIPISEIVSDINKEEDRNDLELERTTNENEIFKRQLKDYKITKIIAYVGFAIAIASFIVSILK
ncbi:hypothetical protein [Elizabethkingia anophelis]|uniref:hypothetical protein n=1 Tax=Elizabethkingia anophelis TaxID=1117645 RepID=UPI0016859E59|nr:hypothetical protein [Elizabethkingia anophelis]QNV11290.1 hypothetical protein EIY88_18990 [Elizabethkingia anophelis]UTF89430.1 hypothetical protein J2N93_19040 [Elizabethkingia anophelis]UTG04050.1 hypothetical protein J2O03_18940 [Elizabethkingia anophelis]UTG07793.1 hypothetical protein J2N99_18925 [Elizabethkingia anophelis]UTG11535.1 hypothetical protein J2N92_18925 [Elizabethkingia anophelis]